MPNQNSLFFVPTISDLGSQDQKDLTEKHPTVQDQSEPDHDFNGTEFFPRGSEDLSEEQQPGSSGDKHLPEKLEFQEKPEEPRGIRVPYVDTSRPPRGRMYVPVDLDEALLLVVAAEHLRFVDHYRWIIHSILSQRLTDRRFDEDSYVPLNQVVLRQFISQRKTKQFLDHLKKWEFIESNNRSYLAGEFSIGYRLTQRYRSSRIIAIDITDVRLAKKVGVRAKIEREVVEARRDGYSAVLGWLEALTINEVSAHEHTNAHFEPDSDARNARFQSIDSIAHGQYRLDIDGSGRAHHNLSNLAGDLRPFVSIGGRPLYQVDIACSQSWFMHLFLRNRIADREERLRMEELLLSGDFYPTLNTRQIDIDPFKEAFFTHVLCGRGDYSNWVTRSFEKLFPSYAMAIAEAKGDYYKQFAVTLQRTEAMVVFDAVKRFVATTAGKVPVLTIHDSLVTWPEWTRTARDALEAAFHDQHGVKPLLRVKPPDTTIKSTKNSQKPKPNKMEKKERLTCVEIKVIGTIKTAHGVLIRFSVRFSNGETGEYWGKTEASAKNFPVNVSHWYASTVLTKHDGVNTRKYRPCKKEEIPVGEYVDDTVILEPAKHESDIHVPVQGVSRPFAKGEPNFPSGGATAEDIVALKGALSLVTAGKIELDQVEETASKLKKTIIKLSNQ